ncbi:MAG: hypothetical protein FJ316_10170 [SAR202 cluster bacterium]|nr:hypothetical protein [SAR202 cluster bacterium]
MLQICRNRAEKVICALALMLLLAAAACSQGGPKQLELAVQVEGGRMAPHILQAHQGDNLILTINSKESGELHVHGYDLEVPVEAGKPAELRMTAEATGRFKITFHATEVAGHSHDPASTGTPPAEEEEKEIGYLEVQPR